MKKNDTELTIKYLSDKDAECFKMIECLMKSLKRKPSNSPEGMMEYSLGILDYFRKIDDKAAVIDNLNYGIACRDENDPAVETYKNIVTLMSDYIEKAEAEQE